MKDSYDCVLKPVGQLMSFLKYVTITVITFAIIFFSRWIDPEKVKKDFDFLGSTEKSELYAATASERENGTTNILLQHEVQLGETLPLIARKYNISWIELAKDNHITDYTKLKPGTILYIHRK